MPRIPVSITLALAASLLAGCGTPKIKSTAPLGATAGARGRAVAPKPGAPMAPSEVQSKASFVCLMCPGTASPKPGLCPVCGRTLLPRKVKENLARNPSTGGPKIEFEVIYTPRHSPVPPADQPAVEPAK